MYIRIDVEPDDVLPELEDYHIQDEFVKRFPEFECLVTDICHLIVDKLSPKDVPQEIRQFVEGRTDRLMIFG